MVVGREADSKRKNFFKILSKSDKFLTFASKKCHRRRVNLCIGTEALKREDVAEKG